MKNRHYTLEKLAESLGQSEADLLEKISFLLPENRPPHETFHLVENGLLRTINVRCTGIGNIINDFGDFMQFSMELNDSWVQYSVLVKANKYDKKRLPIFEMREYFLTRFDSHCETQMLFGDKTCDCMTQLDLAMEQIASHGEGAIIHIKSHEGRGKGIASKLDQLSICNALGIDTITASKLRAEIVEGIDTEQFPSDVIIDKRDFTGCVAILKYLNVPNRVKLMLQTNNPNKKRALEENGYICEYFNIHTKPTEHNQMHLQAKKDELNHNL